MTGIYKITINDYYIYIGQSVDMERRWKQHLKTLNENTHCNKKLQNIYNKYSNTIKFEIIEECDADELDDKEIFYIEQFNTFDTNHGLNMDLGGFGHHKYKTHEEVKQAKKQNYKRYKKTHEEELKEYYKQRYSDNKNELKVKFKQYYLDKKTKFKRYYLDNKEKIKEYHKQHYQNNKDRCKQRYQNNRYRFKEYGEQRRRQKGMLSHSVRHKLQFETRYNLSRSLTDEEWNIWINTKYKGKSYAIKFLKTLPNMNFTIPPKKNFNS